MTPIRVAILALLLAAPAAAQDFSGIVREEKAKLEAAGFDFRVGAPGDEPRCAAAQITWRAAHRLAQMGHRVFLIDKSPDQNGCTHTDGQRYSHDAIVYQATCIDVLVQSETENRPAWNICSNPVVDPARWRPTFALDDGPPTPQIGAPPCPPPVDVSRLEDKLDTVIARVEAHETAAAAERAAQAAYRDAVRSTWTRVWTGARQIGWKLAPVIGGFIAGVIGS